MPKTVSGRAEPAAIVENPIASAMPATRSGWAFSNPNIDMHPIFAFVARPHRAEARCRAHASHCKRDANRRFVIGKALIAEKQFVARRIWTRVTIATARLVVGYRCGRRAP